MRTVNLRKVGGSVMLAVPPALLDILHLQPGSKVGSAIESGRRDRLMKRGDIWRLRAAVISRGRQASPCHWRGREPKRRELCGVTNPELSTLQRAAAGSWRRL